MRKIVIFILFICLPILLFSQNDKKIEKKEFIDTTIPVQAQYSKIFEISQIYFNKKIDLAGRGEILEIAMEIKNLTDEPMDLYLFTVATFEKGEKTQSSFEMPIPPKEKLRTFVPYPNELDNFKYPLKDEKGNALKDKKGRDMFRLIKLPKDPKKGQHVKLKDKIQIRTYHLSEYKTNYYYFNNVALLIFDENGKPAYRQFYSVKGFRR